MDGVWNDEHEYEDMKQRVNEHIRDLKAVKNPKFYIV